MLTTVLELLLAPALVGVSGLVAHRWDERAGGFVSAFPAIVGPLLLVAAQEHGERFAARAAAGTLLGLVALSAFVLVYGHTARRASWPVALAGAWAAAAACALAVGRVPAGTGVACGAAVASLLVAHRALPAGIEAPAVALRLRELPARMALTALLIAALAVAAGRLGPTVAGILAALPVLASVLATTTHRGQGAASAVELLRGMLAGMGGFVAYCLVFALAVVPAGVLVAVAAATVACIAAQAATFVPARATAPARAVAEPA